MSDGCARRSTAVAAPIRSAPCAAPAMRSMSVSANPPDASLAVASLAGRAPVAPPVGDRLIGDARMITAIRQALDRLAAAEEEVGRAGIADRPVALVLAQLEQRA